MSVSIIIINYNTFALTSNCIESVIAHTVGVKYEIILVDNASKECNADLFLAKFPNIVLIKSKENGGFAKGNNWGIAHANGDLILLLNSDTYLTEDSVSIAANAFNEQEIKNGSNKVGAVGVRMVYPNGKPQHSARCFRSISWELLDLFRFITLCLPYEKRAKLMMGKYFKADFTTPCDWVNGAFFIFPKSILSVLPWKKLDERFFMYGEDQLWCHQFTSFGYPSLFLASTTIVHINNGSTSKNKRLQLIRTMMQNELVIMEARKGKKGYYWCFCAIYLAKEYSRYAVKYLLYSISGKTLS